MDRKFALVALWTLFAAAAVGVGFGAAGLVGDPLADGVAGAVGARAQASTAEAETVLPAGEDVSPSTVPSSPRSQTPTPTDTGTAEPATTRTPTSEPTRSTRTTNPPRSVTRTLSTRGGLVSATCRSGLVRLGASPAVGWAIEDIDGGARREGRVRFERSDDGEDRVEVEVTCAAGQPRFALDDDSGGGGDDETEEPDDSDDSRDSVDSDDGGVDGSDSSGSDSSGSD